MTAIPGRLGYAANVVRGWSRSGTQGEPAETGRVNRVPWDRGAVMSVLVVDDDPVTAHTFARVLEEHGYRTLIAADGTEVWPILEQVPVALVIVELQMPGMNGWEVIRRLHPRFPSALQPLSPCKILVVSARGDDETVSFVHRLGADGFLAKPVTPINLIRAVDRLLASASTHALGTEAGL